MITIRVCLFAQEESQFTKKLYFKVNEDRSLLKHSSIQMNDKLKLQAFTKHVKDFFLF